MSADLAQLIVAIEGLQSNPWKDFILPISTVLLSGGLGVGVAYYSIERQEKTKLEINKIRAVNDVMLIANNMRSCLIAIKENYSKLNHTEPLKRLLKVPRVISSFEKVNVDLISLSFIAPTKIEQANKWNRLEYIGTIFENYNFIMDIWGRRNEEMNANWNSIIELHKMHNLDDQQVITTLGRVNALILTDLTEQAIRITDELIVEISCFLIGFPELAIKKLDKKIQKNYGHVIRVKLPVDDVSIEFMSRIPSVDFSEMAKLHGQSEKSIINRYRDIYSLKT